MIHKEKNDKLDSIKIKNVALSKDTKNKKQATDGRNYL